MRARHVLVVLAGVLLIGATVLAQSVDRVIVDYQRAAEPLSACLSGLLPRLPDELEYRRSGVALVLVDAHLHIVIDVLHGAFTVS